MPEPQVPRLLVTGATGFVGRHLVAALQGAGYAAIRCLTHRHAAPFAPGVGVDLVAGDVRVRDSLDRAMEGVDLVVHLVATIQERPGGVTFTNVNHLGTRNVVEAAKKAGVRRLVHQSAVGADPDPARLYSRSKWLGEQEVIGCGIPFTILRPSIIFGKGDEFLNTLAAVVKLFPVVPIAGSGTNRFQPISVQDVARCLVQVVSQEEYIGRTVEIGGPRQYTYRQIVDLLVQALSVRRKLVRVPVGPMRPIAGAMEAMLPRPPVTREQLKYLDIDNVAQGESVEAQFGFTPQSLEEGLDYIRDLGWREALAINLGRMPRHVRDH
jgi:NADH dehydrogenase